MPAQPSQRGKFYRFLLITTLLLTGLMDAPGAAGRAASQPLVSSPLSQASAANQVTVTTTSDEADGDVTSFAALADDPGPDSAVSLREALEAANNTPAGPRLTIGFAIPTDDLGYDYVREVWPILPTTPLPPLARGSVTIDGSTQAGSTLRPSIVLDGYELYQPDPTSGLEITSAGNSIRRLTIVNFYTSGVLIRGDDATNNEITGSVIGLSPTADAGESNDYGIELRDGAHANTIGGASPEARNIISGNFAYGVYIHGAETSFNIVMGNWIGTGHSGVTGVGNERGIGILDGAHDNLVGGALGNIIADNKIGIELHLGAHHNVIAGNTVGLGADGKTKLADKDDPDSSLGNTDGGIFLLGGAHNNIIGGSAPELRNVIANNGETGTVYGDGIRIDELGTSANSIFGNYIGVDRTGIISAGNLRYGIYIKEAAGSNYIGGSQRSSGNVISYNGAGGLRIESPANEVRNNYIGVGSDGTTPLGNQKIGVRVSGPSNVIGPNNVVAYNHLSGVIVSASGVGSTVQSNQIHHHSRSGVCIDGATTTISNNVIYENGGSTNAELDCDASGGVVMLNAQNSGILSNLIQNNHDVGVRLVGGRGNQIRTNSITDNAGVGIELENGANDNLAPPQLTVAGNLITGTGCPGCNIEIFSDPANQGAHFVASITANANGAFSLVIDTTQLPEQYITATNTDANGNTSAFAEPVLSNGQLPVRTIQLFIPMIDR
jgi:parallel beta-helix repeat protein